MARLRHIPPFTPWGGFLAFLVMLGWEGPLCTWVSWLKSDWLGVGIGVFFTLIFWVPALSALFYEPEEKIAERKEPQ